MISSSFREITLEGIGAAEGREQTWEQGNLLAVQGEMMRPNRSRCLSGQRGWHSSADAQRVELSA